MYIYLKWMDVYSHPWWQFSYRRFHVLFKYNPQMRIADLICRLH